MVLGGHDGPAAAPAQHPAGVAAVGEDDVLLGDEGAHRGGTGFVFAVRDLQRKAFIYPLLPFLDKDSIDLSVNTLMKGTNIALEPKIVD